jgi:uncharacterized DUF497 family protein
VSTRFEWDPVKAAVNLCKHAVSFDIAMRVFADPFALTEQTQIDGGEERWLTLGIVDEHLLLLVAHTTRNEQVEGHPIEIIRIISARKVDRKERRRYEQETR